MLSRGSVTISTLRSSFRVEELTASEGLHGGIAEDGVCGEAVMVRAIRRAVRMLQRRNKRRKKTGSDRPVLGVTAGVDGEFFRSGAEA